jgi:hypothetical protein
MTEADIERIATDLVAKHVWLGLSPAFWRVIVRDVLYEQAAIEREQAAAAKMRRETEFQECAECSAKPGTPTLCPDCLRRRDAYYRAKK